MRNNPSRRGCGMAVLLLGVFSLVSSALADSPPGTPLVSVLALDPAAAEAGSDTATFLIVRIGPATTPLTVPYTLSGTAENGADYTRLNGAAIIPQGANFVPVVVAPVDDYDVEGEESVVLALQTPFVWPPPYVVAWPSAASAAIADNDLAPTNVPPRATLVSPPNGAVFESDDEVPIVAHAFDRDGAVLTVEFFDRTNSLGIVTHQPILAPAGWTDAGKDPLQELDGALFPTLDASSDTAEAVPIPAPGNLFRFRWQSPAPGSHVLTAVATDNEGATTRSAPVEIRVLQTAPQPVVTVRADDPEATEPDPYTDHLDTATFRIHRTGPTQIPLMVFYHLSGTASNGVDYRELPFSAVIPAGERSVAVVVTPLDDPLVEGPEGVGLTIVPPLCIAIYPPPADCYLVGRAHSARAVIRDNDTPPNQPPLVRLISPGDGNVLLAPADLRLAALARDLDGFVTAVEFFEGTNRLGEVTNNPLALSPMEPQFALVWSNVPPGKYLLSAAATDNAGAKAQSQPVEIKVVLRFEPPLVNVKVADPEAAEPGVLTVINPAIFEVTRAGATSASLLVFYSISGSASNGVDYRPLTGQVLIPAGASGARIVVEPLHDLLVEGTETVVVQLEPSPIVSSQNTGPLGWYRIGSNAVSRAIILDNDVAPTNLPPRVAIVLPNDGAVVTLPAIVGLAALAQDPDGWVLTVEFFDGSTSLGVVTNDLRGAGTADVLPEEWYRLWGSFSPGAHVLTARATDNRGATSWSDPVNLKVLPGPVQSVVTIRATDPFASEGNWIGPVTTTDAAGPVMDPRGTNTATFTVTREGDTNLDLTVFYRMEGTASNGLDYVKLSGQITIPRGETQAKIVVDPVDDNLTERTETVVAVLEPMAYIAIWPPPPGGYIVGDPNQAVAYIYDNDGNQSPRLEIVHPQDGAGFRAYANIEMDVVTQDPDGWVGKMEFFANDLKIGEQVMYFFVPPAPGEVQKFALVWTNAVPGAYVLTARATDDRDAIALSDPVRIKVLPSSPNPAVSIVAVDSTASEPNPITPAFDSAHFRVTRTGDLSGSLTVAYRIGGSASNGLDYQKLTGEVTLPTNAATAMIQVLPFDDRLVEGTESVILSLVQPPCVTSNVVSTGCYLVGQPGQAIAYIRDNDAPANKPPTVSLVSPANGSVFAAPVDLRLVAAAGDPDGWVTAVEFFDGTNRLGIVPNPAVILDAPLLRMPELSTDVLTDDTQQRPFVLIWSNAPPGKHLLTAVATDNAGDTARSRPIELTIREPSQVPVVRIMATDAVAREGTSNTAAFRIQRTGNTNAALGVWFEIRGSASNGVDYVSLPNWITIPAGRRSARILVTPVDDLLPERPETVRLHLTESPLASPLTYEIGRPDHAGVMLLDNDQPLRPTEVLLDGSLHLRLPVPVGLPFRLEASTNLFDWQEVASDINTEDGVSVVDDGKAEHPVRFFRVIQEFGDLDDEE